MNNIQQLKEQLKIYRTFNEPYKRFGNENDGGYVMVDDLKSSDYIISCGIGNNDNWVSDAAVEIDLSKNLVGVDMYDIEPVDISGMPDKLKFYQKRIGHGFAIRNMLDLAGDHNDYLLKMDIEGGEIGCFNSSESQDISKFRQIVLEIHDIVKYIQTDEIFNDMLNIFKKINETHRLVLVHPNNYATVVNINEYAVPDVIEVLFLRKDSYNFVDVDYPEYLNSPCNPDNIDISLFYL